MGGDYLLSKEILKLINMSRGVKTFVEAFGGSGFISSIIPRNKFNVIIYNDKDKLLYNFYKILKERYEELANEIEFIPYSRQINRETLKEYKENRLENNSEMEKALKFFYLLNTSFFGKVGGGWGVSIERNTARGFHNKVELIKEMSKIWKDIIVENYDFREIFKIYDREHTLFYCDPPFLTKQVLSNEEDVEELRNYTYDYYGLGFEEKDMKDLLDILGKIKGKYVLKLPINHLKISFINEWSKNRNYVVIEHQKFAQKKIGESKDFQKTIFFYNFGDKIKSITDYQVIQNEENIEKEKIE
jgi:site-specific DNA-adenine methylase